MEKNTASADRGALYIVATPIGNLKDITRRAVETLETAEWIAAEDTRHTQKLLQSLGIQKPLISLHDHNEQAKSVQLLERLQQGENGALVSDAGTPLINDPGFHLVKLLRQQGVRVVPIPGPSAVITALSAAGLPTDRFSYEGFLPAKNQKRLKVLENLKSDQRTLVFYESPHRLMETLQAMQSQFGGSRQMVAAREMTKTFEQFVSGSMDEVLAYFETHPDKVRGEFVLMVMGDVAVKEAEAGEYDALIQALLKQNLPIKQIAEIVADYSGQKKKVFYTRALELKAL